MLTCALLGVSYENCGFHVCSFPTVATVHQMGVSLHFVHVESILIFWCSLDQRRYYVICASPLIFISTMAGLCSVLLLSTINVAVPDLLKF